MILCNEYLNFWDLRKTLQSLEHRGQRALQKLELALSWALFWCFGCTGFFIVQEGQVGVVTQFGKYKYTAGAGIQWHLPYPIQDDETVNSSQIRSATIGTSNKIQAANLKDSSMLTSDENVIDVRFAVQYRIKDPVAFLFNNADTEGSVVLAAETAVREVVGKNKMDYVLYEGREQISNDLATLIQRILDSYKAGILVTSVTIQHVQPPEQVQAAFDDAVKAGQDRERQKNEAQAYANDVIPRARGGAARLLEEAKGYESRIVSQAEGDAQRFTQIQASYAKAPEVTRERMYLQTMQGILSHTTKILVDTHGSNSLLYLPLDKLIERMRPPTGSTADTGNSSSAISTQSNSAAPVIKPADDNIRSRDMLKDRERESR